jgi:uncharacterized membrane protein YphA (DoxX/SURF4 family)
MPPLFVAGRVIFVLYFIFAGLQRLMNVAGSAEFFASKFAIPPALVPLSDHVASLVGLSTYQLLALLAGAVELAAGLLIAFNVGTRVMAGVLIVFTALAVFYGYDFWTMADGQRETALTFAMLNVSMIGGLLLFVALGSSRPTEPGRPENV